MNMNIEKAREFYSAYHEGSLDKGLKQAFERQLETDAQVAAEFRLFKQAMEELSQLESEAIEVPSDLHDRISARLDLHILEQRRKKEEERQRTGSFKFRGAYNRLSQLTADERKHPERFVVTSWQEIVEGGKIKKRKAAEYDKLNRVSTEEKHSGLRSLVLQGGGDEGGDDGGELLLREEPLLHGEERRRRARSWPTRDRDRSRGDPAEEGGAQARHAG